MLGEEEEEEEVERGEGEKEGRMYGLVPFLSCVQKQWAWRLQRIEVLERKGSLEEVVFVGFRGKAWGFPWMDGRFRPVERFGK